MKSYFEILNREDQKRAFYLEVLKWFLIGLLIRLLIMPFSFHGHDIFWINYLPFKFANGGVFDPYLFLKETYPEVKYTYYPPVIFYIFSLIHLFFKLFLGQLNNLYTVFEQWNFTITGNTIHYASIFEEFSLFRILFYFKIPYLFFDLGIAVLLLDYFKEEKEKSILALALWMLNPFVIHSIFALGQMDIVAMFFLMASIISAKKDKPYLAISLLVLGGGVKVFPFLLVPPMIIMLRKSFIDRVKMSLFACFCLFLIFGPFFLSSGELVLGSFGSNIGFSLFRKGAFLLSYAILMIFMLYINEKSEEKSEAIIPSMSLVLMLFYIFISVNLRYFTWITPLLLIMFLKDKKYCIYGGLFFLSLFLLRAPDNDLQWGLFSTLYPEFFSGLPIFDSFLNLLFDVHLLHKVMYRIFIISSGVFIFHIIIKHRYLICSMIKVKNEES